MKTFKKILSLLLAGVMTLSLLAAVPFTAVAAEGDINWTATEIVLDSPEDLLAFDKVNPSTYNYFDNQTIKLGADIDMGGQTWTPISHFRGVFDGQGYAIKNLSISGTGSELAMFTRVQGAEFRNLQLIGVDVKNTVSGTPTSMTRVGALVTRSQGTCTYENIYVSGNVQNVSANGNFRAGGIIAEVNSGTANFKQCVSDCVVYGGFGVGGIIGYAVDGTSTYMSDCVFGGKLCHTRKYTGGLVGGVEGDITFERCLMLGIHESNGYKSQAGVLFTSVDSTNAGVIKLIDCYAALDSTRGVNLIDSTDGASVGNYIEIVYNNETVYGSSTTVLADANVAVVCENLRTFVVDETKTIRTSFASDYPKLANTMVPVNNQVRTYAIEIDGKLNPNNDVNKYNVNWIIPKTVYQMLVNADFYGVQFSEISETAKTYDIRFVGTLNCDNLKFAEILGFKIVATYMENGEETSMTYDCSGSLVYASVAETANGVVREVTAAELGADYLYALTITDIPAAVAEIEFTVTPYVKADNNINVSKASTTLTVTCENDVIAVNGKVIE